MTKRLSNISLHSADDFKEIIEDFKNESDRATVILGAAKLDAQLYLLLSKVLKPSSNNQDDLLDGDNPLGTFSSRINIAYRLGLINNHFAKSLHLVRKIRNSFAHETKGISLTSGGHSDRVKELIVYFKDFEDYHLLKRDYFGENDGLDIDFRMLLGIAILRLDSAIYYSTTITDVGTVFLPPKWEKRIVEDTLDDPDQNS